MWVVSAKLEAYILVVYVTTNDKTLVIVVVVVSPITEVDHFVHFVDHFRAAQQIAEVFIEEI
jgi:hypothetical protein